MSDVTTVEGKNFRTEDVTHRPRRMQNVNVLNAVKASASDLPQYGEASYGPSQTPVPQAVTLESAIKFYASSVDPLQGDLHRATAKWLIQLRELMSDNRVREIVYSAPKTTVKIEDGDDENE